VTRVGSRVMLAVAGVAVLGMTATLAGAQTHQATYPLNEVMQAPFASDMLAAPTGTAVAWVFGPTFITPHKAKCRTKYAWLRRPALLPFVTQ
jgi:hypothetical protein